MGRVGRKRSDKRWEDSSGGLWASRFECEVFETLSDDARLVVLRCSQGDSHTFPYHSKVLKGSCMECGSSKIIQRRTYTPDLFVVPTCRGSDGRGYYIETKGYFPGPQRKLSSDFLRTGEDIDLRSLSFSRLVQMHILPNSYAPSSLCRAMQRSSPSDPRCSQSRCHICHHSSNVSKNSTPRLLARDFW